MDRDPAIEQALRRLLGAVDALDAALELRLDGERRSGSLADQVEAFSLDRTRLADELDRAHARGRALAEVNREAGHRLDEAMKTIRNVIAAAERQSGDPGQSDS